MAQTEDLVMRSVIEEMIERRFKADHNCVIVRSPDHPFLILRPNILIGRSGQLLAVFIPYKNEETSPERLLVRLALSKLALPSNLMTVLISKSWGREVDNQFERNFDAVIHENDKNISGSLMKMMLMDKKNNDDIEYILKKNQKKTFLRMDLFIKYSVRNTREHKKTTIIPNIFEEIKSESQKVYIPSWINSKKIKLSSNLLNYHGAIITSADFERRNNLYNTLANLIFLSTKMLYQLDNGIPYQHQNIINPNIVFVDKIPLGHFDPLKPVRAAAFGGWIYMNNEDTSGIEEIQDRMYKLQSRGVLK